MAIVQKNTVIEEWSFDAKQIPKELMEAMGEEGEEIALLEFVDHGSEGKDKYRFPLQMSKVDGLIGELQKLKGSKLHVAGADDMPPPPPGA